MKNLFITSILLFTLLLSSCKKNYEDGTYEAPEMLVLAGPSEAKMNNSVDYATYFIPGTYVWSVTGDAAITAGQGTSKVTVKFGSQNSRITVSVADKTVSKEIIVQ